VGGEAWHELGICSFSLNQLRGWEIVVQVLADAGCHCLLAIHNFNFILPPSVGGVVCFVRLSSACP